MSTHPDVGAIDVSEADCCASQDCIDAPAKLSLACDQPNALGLLVAGQAMRVSANLLDQPGGPSSSCAIEGGRSQVAFRFQVDAPSRLDFEIVHAAELDLVMELREHRCDEAAGALFCTDAEDQVYFAEAGKDYFLIVESRDGQSPGPFELRVSARGALCAPAGQWSCEATSRVQCFGGQEQRSFQCATSCTGDSCAGDSCENAIEVTSSTSFSGQSAAYTSAFDFSDKPGCTSSGISGLTTLGQDLVFFLPGLLAGQKLFVDALTNDTNDNLIAVLDTCSAQAGCVAAASIGNQLRWQVERGGDYYVIIDKTTSTARDFHYRIEIDP
ncbi:MAG: hypothetical protein H0U74_11130 [Bradymonadaceae bacterium]|nr:hypothetical protein [Lujinxingiaceae bacterium]